jgi:hypothetical protein
VFASKEGGKTSCFPSVLHSSYRLLILSSGRAAFTAGLAGLIASEFMRGAFLVRYFAPLAPGFPRFVTIELMGGAFLMSGFASHARDLALLLLVHGCEATVRAAATALVGASYLPAAMAGFAALAGNLFLLLFVHGTEATL